MQAMLDAVGNGLSSCRWRQVEDILDQVLLKDRSKMVYTSAICYCSMLIRLFDVVRIMALWYLRAGGKVGGDERGRKKDHEWRGISGRCFVGDGLLAHVAPGIVAFGRGLGLHRVELLQ